MKGRLGLTIFMSGALACVGTSRAIAEDSPVAVSFARIKPSLALIANSAGWGTGFCVGSTALASYYLTNAHVVGTDAKVVVFRQFPTFQKLTGTVIAKGVEEDPDLAVVRVDVGRVPALKLRTTTPKEGDQIAEAGYPVAQLSLATIAGDSMTPSIHVGTVAALANRGGLIEFDAQTEPGNSGGPLFDPATGDVIGVVRAKIKGTTEANLAVGVSRIVIAFLKQHDIAFVESQPRPTASADAINPASPDVAMPAILKTLPGAGSVAVIYDTSRLTGTATPEMVQAAAEDFAGKFGREFSVSAFAIEGHAADAQGVAEIIGAHNALIGAYYGGSFNYTSPNGFTGQSKVDVSLSVALFDTFGQRWFSAKKRKTVSSARDSYSAVTSSFADLNDQEVAALSQQMRDSTTDESGVSNFFRYALPMSNGERRVFLLLQPGANGARVTLLPSFSVAAGAGLQLGDTVTKLNEIQLAGKSQDELLTILRTAAKSGAEDLEIIGGDGIHQHIQFEPKDLRWYLEHRQGGPS